MGSTDANTGRAVGLGGTTPHTINGGSTWARQTGGTSPQDLGVELQDVRSVPELGPITMLRIGLAGYA